MIWQKDDLIEKLQVILELYSRVEAIRSKIENFEPEDHYERKVPSPVFPGKYKTIAERDALLKVIDHREDNAVQQMKLAYKRIYEPKKPQEPKIEDFKDPDTTYQEKENLKKYGYLKIVGAVIGSVFGVSFIANLGVVADLGLGPVMPTLVITTIGVLMFVFGKNKQAHAKLEQQKQKDEALTAYNQKKAELLAEYKEKMHAYDEATAVFNDDLQSFLENYAKWREIFLRKLQEEMSIREKLEDDREAGARKILEEEYAPALKELIESNNLVAEEYLPVLNIIIDLIKSGRADDLKEAINLYEDIVYRERQLELEREKEDQRRWEEEQRRRDEERHHKEQMKFQQDQERQRQREEARRQQDEERRHKEEMDQRERQERNRRYEEQQRADEERRRAERSRWEQEQEQSRAASKQCQACAYAGRCNMMTYNKTPNCTGFTPR